MMISLVVPSSGFPFTLDRAQVSFRARVLLANLTDLTGRQYPPLTGLPPSSSSDNDK